MKKWDLLCSFHVPFQSCQKKVHFFNFVRCQQKNISKNNLIHICIWKVSLRTSEDISVWNQKILLNFCWVSIVFDILIANISWTVAQTPINHIIFWKTVIKTFRSIYVNCFSTIRFLAEVSTKLQKMHFYGQFKDHNSGRKHGN